MTTDHASAPFSDQPVLVVGATGYVGARLVPRLLDAGYSVRCLARSPLKLESRSWIRHPNVAAVQGDLIASDNLADLMRGCGAAFYLAHSMRAGSDEDTRRDEEAARRFAAAASEAGVARIVYLGGLAEAAPGRDDRLARRSAVQRVLASGDVATTVFRTAMIVGAGSASFEVLRYLSDRLPIVLAPSWLRSEFQPISVRNVLDYLVACLAEPLTAGRTFDIGGPDVVTFAGLMQLVAEETGLRRRIIIPVPVMSPRFSALWVRAITPVPLDIARPLVEGLRSRVVCRDREAEALMPVALLGAREAVQAALRRHGRGGVESNWSDAGLVPGDPVWAGGRVFLDRKETIVDASPASAFEAVCRIGGPHGWHTASFLWRLRGRLDTMTGGPGLLRGRRDPDALRYGDAVDFWRVSAVEPGRLLRLNAEMKLPGEASLEFAIEPLAGAAGGAGTPARCRLVQTATFVPHGILGLAYWYSVLPFHAWIFPRMLRGIRRSAEQPATRRAAGPPGDPDAGTGDS
jgi:uncharacterized protein YbjT (DUF2867 family)